MGSSQQMTQSNESLEEIANADEPPADKEWLKRYNRVKQNEELEQMLQKRLNSMEHVDFW